MNNLKMKVVYYLMDYLEVYFILGCMLYVLEFILGWVIIKMD